MAAGVQHWEYNVYHGHTSAYSPLLRCQPFHCKTPGLTPSFVKFLKFKFSMACWVRGPVCTMHHTEFQQYHLNFFSNFQNGGLPPSCIFKIWQFFHTLALRTDMHHRAKFSQTCDTSQFFNFYNIAIRPTSWIFSLKIL